MGLLDFECLCCPRPQCSMATYPCSAQPQSIHAMPNRNRRVSLQCPTAEYPYSAQPPSIPAVPTAEYPRNAQPQPQSIPAVPNHEVSLQCPTAQYIFAVRNHQVSLQCPTAKRMHCISRAMMASGWGCSKWIIWGLAFLRLEFKVNSDM